MGIKQRKSIDTPNNMHDQKLIAQNKRDKEIAKTLEKNQLPKGKEVKLKRDFYLYVGDTVFNVWFNGHDYRFVNLSNNKVYWISPGEEKTLGREGEIRIDKTDTLASRKHLKLRVDNESNLFLCDNSKHGTFVDEVEKIMDKTPKILKLTDSEKSKFNSIKEILKPKYKTTIDGKTFYLSDKFGKGHKHMWAVGYVEDGGKIEERYFWRSESEGYWRSAPCVKLSSKGGVAVSKGEDIDNYSYESTTKVHILLGKVLDSRLINESEKRIGRPVDGKNIVKTFQDEIFIDKLFPALKGSGLSFYHPTTEKTVEDVKRDYKNLNIAATGLDYKNMKRVPQLDYSYEHNYFGIINVKPCVISRKGKNVIFYFAYAKNDPKKQVWIDNAVYEDAKINSVGLYSRQINIGPLAAKPMDYYYQCTKERKEMLHDKRRIMYYDEGKNKYSDYYDIRDFYQECPIIQHYKDLEGIKY